MTTGVNQIRHARSVQDFPNLKLEKDEYVELAISRSNLVLGAIWVGMILAEILLVVLTSLLVNSQPVSPAFALDGFTKNFVNLLTMVACFILVGICVVASIIYKRNKLYITNKRAIQMICTSPFHSSINVIELNKIEDVSFKQNGVLEYLLKFGTIRMATVGDETTYTFKYIDTPRDELETIMHLVHVSKNDK